MPSHAITGTLRDGVLLSVVASTYLLVLLRLNPRLFLRHYPKEVRNAVPPRSRRERSASALLGVFPILLWLIAARLGYPLLWQSPVQSRPLFTELFAHAFGVIFLFNLVDLLVLDWLIVCWINPSWAIIPGTEHLVIPRHWFYHFKGFLLGTVLSAIVGLAVATALS